MAPLIESIAVRHFIATLQVAAGRVVGAEHTEIPDLFAYLTDSLPARPQPCEPPLLRALLMETACRIELLSEMRRNATALSADLLLISSAISPEQLRLSFNAFLEGVRRAGVESALSHRPVDRRVVQALDYVHRNAMRPSLRLIDVATVVGMSKWHLERLLRRDTGHCFKSHLRQTRMIEASRLLRESPLTIKEIAGTLGYSHVSNFDREFRRSFRSTPSRWRAARAC